LIPELNPHSLLAYCKSELEPLLDRLRRAVEIESPTSSKAGVDRLANFFAQEFERHSGQVRVLGHPTAGSSVIAEFWGGRRHQKPILILGHLDTVWEAGTLSRMPFRIRQGRAYGPGILDMKSGIVCGLWAVRALESFGIVPASPVRFFLNSDEEASSIAFRKRILAEARQARAVLVLEPAGAGGALKTARKGVGEFRITVHGRAAHSGINPNAGVNAISELARQLLRVESFARPDLGLTLSVGVIEGGTRPNVIPERAQARVDVRVRWARDGVAIARKVYGLKPFHPEAKLEISGGINRPPMERASAVKLFRKTQQLARTLGMELREAPTGGGSDGNFTAALGIPTLDGLGGVGDGAHALDEHIVIAELPRRAALLASLIASL
jgi:glutamate carboxypeptidase